MHYGTIRPITQRDMSIYGYIMRFLESVPKHLSQTVIPTTCQDYKYYHACDYFRQFNMHEFVYL